MVMTIPYVNKIKVLSKISPSFPPSGPTSPLQEVRGAVITVEGMDKALLTEVGRYLEEYLSKDPECHVKTWTFNPSSTSIQPMPEESQQVKKDDEPIRGIESESTSRRSSTNESPFISYLDTIRIWHLKSADMIKFITTAPHPSPPPSLSPPPTSTPHSFSSSTTQTQLRPKAPHIPVALLPQGFSLTTSDVYASLIPINDAYAPVDHWQWMATLWRGIVGPDLTIFVKGLTADGEGRDELARFGGVEVRNDCAGIIVRGLLGDGTGSGAGIEEKALRRLGFEVLEFVRGLGSEGNNAYGR
jgi:hypothetical protein